jgi:enoyl-[acyl-carrier protein] reductase I
MPNDLMRGKRGLIMGLANDKSIAWGIARALGDAGAEMAFSYQGEALLKRVAPLAAEVGSDLVLPCDVADMESVDALFASLADRWGSLDFLVTPSASRTRTSCAAATSTRAARTSSPPWTSRSTASPPW